MIFKGHSGAVNNVLSVDVEDWFHLLDLPTTPPLRQWDSLESRVESNFRRLLVLFRRYRVRTTCFFLGWVAERYPALVREAVADGHEIASHGYKHELVFRMTPDEFAADLNRSRKLLEDVSGTSVHGYRAPGFSSIKETPWFFEEVAKAGYNYDSSIFPAARGHGGMPGAGQFPCVVMTPSGGIVEFPVSTVKIGGKAICFFGGGYLRLFPYAIIEKMSRKVQAEGRPVIYYVHPREVDPSHPRLSMSWKRHFQSYIGLKTTQPKIESLLSSFQFTTLAQLVPGIAEPVLRDEAKVEVVVVSSI